MKMVFIAAETVPLRELAGQLATVFDTCSGKDCPVAYCWTDGQLYVLYSSAGTAATDMRSAIVGLHRLPGRECYAVWPYSSYTALLSGCLPQDAEDRLLAVFGGREEFVFVHGSYP